MPIHLVCFKIFFSFSLSLSLSLHIKVHVSLQQTLRALREQIAEVLGLPAEGLHLRRNARAPQLKDETLTLRAAGLTSGSYVHVGHGRVRNPHE